MGCTVTFVQQVEDMALDQAVWEPLTGKIFGVRGQWIYQFNSSTGALENRLRFSVDAAGVSSICALNGNLYCAVSWVNGTAWFSPGGPDVNRDIFVVQASTFTLTGRFNWGHYSDDGGTFVDEFTGGFRTLVTNGSHLFGVNFNTHIFSVDPFNLPGVSFGGLSWADDMAYDSFNNVFWLADASAPNVWAMATDFSNDTFNNGVFYDVLGVTYNLAQNKVYIATGSEKLYLALANDALPGFNNFNLSTLHTGRANANPYRIKSCNGFVGNPFNGLVLIPTRADDTVLVWNPATDNPADMIVNTGFECPIDIVFTPTNAFAVQNAPTGLVLIT